MNREDININWLPLLLREWVDGIGLAATLRIAERYGGIRLHINKTVRPNDELSTLIGVPAAEWLAKRYSGTQEIPRAARLLMMLRNAEIVRRLENNEPAERLAREFSTTRRHIFRIRAEASKLADQADTPTQDNQLNLPLAR